MIRKYDFVKVIDFLEDKEDEEYMEVGKKLVGENAMVIGFYSGGNKPSEFSDYDVEICFFDEELQKMAMDNGFDYWDVSELEVI